MSLLHHGYVRITSSLYIMAMSPLHHGHVTVTSLLHHGYITVTWLHHLHHGYITVTSWYITVTLLRNWFILQDQVVASLKKYLMKNSLSYEPLLE